MFKNTEYREKIVEKLKSLVQSLSDEITIELLDETADEITGDFVMHRLPPPCKYDDTDIDNENDNDNDNSDISNDNTNVSVKKNKKKKSEDQNKNSISNSDNNSNRNGNEPNTNRNDGNKNTRNNYIRNSYNDFNIGGNRIENCELDPLSLIRLCDPRSMFCMIKEENGVNMLAMAHNKNNDRTRHMGHPSSSSEYDDSESVTGSEEGNNDDDDDNDDDEDGKENGDEYDDEIENGSDDDTYDDDLDEEDEEGFIWSLYLPLRLSAVIIGLQLACCPDENLCNGTGASSSTSISLHDLQEMMKKKRIFPDEVRKIFN